LLESLAKISERAAEACRESAIKVPAHVDQFWIAGIVLNGITTQLRAEIEKLSNARISDEPPRQ